MSILQLHTVRQEVLLAEQGWIDCCIKNDVETLSEFLTNDFLYSSPLGDVCDRATYLQKLVWRRVQTISIKPRNVTVQVHQHTAIVTATWAVQETYKCSSDRGLNRIMRVWFRQPDRWRLAAFQVVTLPQ